VVVSRSLAIPVAADGKASGWSLLFVELDDEAFRLCPIAKGVSSISLLCFAGGSLKAVQHTRLQLRSASLSIANHEANRIVEVTNDDVAFQGQRRIKSEFLHYSYLGLVWHSAFTKIESVTARLQTLGTF
jgi:hypothetical protein